MKKKVIILSLFVSVFLLTISVSSVEAVSCIPGGLCQDNQTDSCKYCSASNKYSGGSGYVKGGILKGICDITNTSNCEMDAACWTSKGVFSNTAGSQSATAVDCCSSSNCTGGKICENGKCVDSGLGVTPTTPVVSVPKVKPTAIMEDPTATSVTGKGTTSNDAKITNIKIYKDTSGCGSDPRVHLDGCTGTGLFSGAPETNSGNIWSAKVDWSTAATKETKYSVKVQDSNGVWSDCVSKIFATTTGADPDRGFGTGVDTSKGGNVFTCSGFEPNGTTKIMCPASESGKSAVQNSWTSVGTSESSCGDLARCEYYTVGVTTNPVISPDTIDPTAPSCTATGTGNNPIASGESFPVKLTVKNANSIKWLCSEFNCTNNSVCNYERDYTVENTLSIDKLDSTGSITTTMAYNNTDSSLKVRRCTFYVSNSATGKTGECKNSVAVKPKESTSNETKCGDANGMEFDSEVGAIENKLGGFSLCKDGVPISSSDNGWSTSLNNNYSKQIKWVCGAGLDVYDCMAHVKKAEENETDDNTNNGGSDDTGSGSLPEPTTNLCGSALGMGREATNGEIIGIFNYDLAGKDIKGVPCSSEATLIGTAPTKYPSAGGETSWSCTKGGPADGVIKCTVKVNNYTTPSPGAGGTNDTIISSNSEFCGSYAKVWGATETWPNRTELINTLGGLCNINKGYIYHTLPETEPTSSNSVTWKCYLSGTGLEGLTTCTAKRNGDATTDVARAPINGKCGTAKGDYYVEDTDFRKNSSGQYDFCETGDFELYNMTAAHQKTTFPSEKGEQEKWTCVGKNGGKNEFCVATMTTHSKSSSTKNKIAGTISGGILYGPTGAVIGSINGEVRDAAGNVIDYVGESVKKNDDSIAGLIAGNVVLGPTGAVVGTFYGEIRDNAGRVVRDIADFVDDNGTRIFGAGAGGLAFGPAGLVAGGLWEEVWDGAKNLWSGDHGITHGFGLW